MTRDQRADRDHQIGCYAETEIIGWRRNLRENRRRLAQLDEYFCCRQREALAGPDIKRNSLPARRSLESVTSQNRRISILSKPPARYSGALVKKASEQIEAQQVELVISEDSDPAEKGGLRRTLV